MVNRVGGLASGMDIDELVKKLMTAERAPLNKLFQKKQTFEWQRDAYRGVNTKLKTFDTYIADNLILKSLNTKTATSSNSSLVSAVATATASGTLSIEGVSQLATAARGVSDTQINATGSTKLSDLGITDTSIELKAIQSNGTMASAATKIEFDPTTTTIDQFVSKINASNAGVSAVFESGKLSITAKNTGDNQSGAEVQVTSGATVFGKLGLTALDGQTSGGLASGGTNAIFQVNGITAERTTNSFTINGYNVTLKDTFNSSRTAAERYNAAYTEWKNTSSVEYNQQISDANTAKNAAITAYNDANTVYTTAKDALFATAGNEAKYNTLGVSFLKDLKTEEKDLLNNLTKPISEADFNTQIDTWKNSADSIEKALGEKLAKLTAEQKTVLRELDSTTLNDMTDVATKYVDMTAKLAIKNTKESEYNTLVDRQTNALNDFKAAYKEINGTEVGYESAVPIAEADLPANTTSPVTMTSTTNVDEMMTKIKDFVTTYNGLIKDLNNQLKETKYKDYTPLTSEQKEEMSENEIKLWEEKAKSGLLRNDTLIRNGLSDMRSLVYQTNHAVENTKYNTLFNVGITTTKNFNDGGTLEIDETKLRKALEEDPDSVVKLLSFSDGEEKQPMQFVENGQTVTKEVDTRGFFQKLRASMKDFEISIEKKAGRSTMTDNQYVIGKNLIDAEKRIDTWQRKLETIESRYWRQFTAMETAINKANQQSSSLFQGQNG